MLGNEFGPCLLRLRGRSEDRDGLRPKRTPLISREDIPAVLVVDNACEVRDDIRR